MYCFQCVMKWFSNGNFKLVWYHLSYSQLTMGALMMLILAVCKVVVTGIRTLHNLSLPLSYLQPSGRASEFEICRSGVRLFQFVLGSRQNENKIRYFSPSFFLFLLQLHISTAQLSAWWRMKWGWRLESVSNRNKPIEGVFRTNWWEGTVFKIQ